jgi:hypothetical protein
MAVRHSDLEAIEGLGLGRESAVSVGIVSPIITQ